MSRNQTVEINRTVFMRFFNEDTPGYYSGYRFRKSDYRYVYSSYFPAEVKNIFELMINRNIILDNEYLLCPVYKDNDIQVGFSGTGKRDEGPFKALQRESGEELGLEPIRGKRFGYAKRILNNSTLFVYDIPINKCRYLDSNDQIEVNPNPDIKSRKLYGFIHGSISEIEHFLKSPKIYRYISQDAIIGIAALKIRDIIQDLNLQIR